jgi:hypothetical protein
VNFHETKFDAVKFSKRHFNVCRNFRKPNQLQIANKETYTKLHNLHHHHHHHHYFHHHHYHHYKHQGLGHLASLISRDTAALASVYSVSQLFSFLVECSGMILNEFGVVNIEGTGSYTCKTAIFWAKLVNMKCATDSYFPSTKLFIWTCKILEIYKKHKKFHPKIMSAHLCSQQSYNCCKLYKINLHLEVVPEGS